MNLKLIILSIFLLLSANSHSQCTEPADSLSMFLNSNPEALCINAIHEGCKIYLSADETDMLISFAIANPQLQMRLLMMPTEILIDPSGKKRKHYSIQLPSALSVKDQLNDMEHAGPMEMDEGARPDIMPLLDALKSHGAVYSVRGQKHLLGFQRFHIELDYENELIVFYMLIPKSHLMADKRMKDTWSIGICSKNERGTQPPPHNDEMMPMQPPMHEENIELRDFLQGDIHSWVKFSIDELNNLNLEE